MKSDHVNQTEAYEARLRRRLEILKTQIESGRIEMAPDLQAVESLKRVRYSADGTVNLATVDGFVRSMALAAEYEQDRDDLRNSASLAEIQTTYFGFLERHFGQFYDAMKERGLTPHDAGLALSRNPSTIAQLTKNLPDFLSMVEEFWASAEPVVTVHIQDMQGTLKGVFGGDLFPSAMENIASKCGLYTDTLILPDPFLKSGLVFKRGTDEKKAYYLIKHALNLLQYKELACADVSPPVVVVLPDARYNDEDENEYFLKMARADALPHAARVFGRPFGSHEELIDFCRGIDTMEKAVTAIKEPGRVLFDTEWSGTLSEQIERAQKHFTNTDLLGTSNPGLILATQAAGRMGASNELLIHAQRLGGTPIIDAPTSWQFLVWKLEYDARRMENRDDLEDMHVVRGMQSLADNEMQWIGRIPSAALIEIRKSGALADIRQILGTGVKNLTETSPADFQATRELVFNNIQTAFTQHKENISVLRGKKWKFAGTDLGSWMVVGSLAVTAAATGAPVWGILALGAEELLAAPKLREIPKSIRALVEQTRSLRRSPVGMLFKLSKNRR